MQTRQVLQVLEGHRGLCLCLSFIAEKLTKGEDVVLAVAVSETSSYPVRTEVD